MKEGGGEREIPTEIKMEFSLIFSPFVLIKKRNKRKFMRQRDI
jgi:hypothetical protein